MDSVSKIIQNKIESLKADKASNYQKFKSAVSQHKILEADYHETEMAMLDRVIYEMEKLATKIVTESIKGSL
ncbi:hypothetical protein [Microscilla marina]|uniref:Uncharacterized protein n=1 Tax=Microscilla marina ATCC 23134 TaxID=313606 RepID=A1ZML9_MICM2|nr:hypothetical protein [Microscilla marina]EAY28399.1 hypothetical protein M23134_03951 [Microscilla marina ATCC 23134]